MATVSKKALDEVLAGTPVVEGVLEAQGSAVDPEKGWVWVTIPDRDMLDYPFTGIGHNLNHYGPGRHKLSPEIAREVQERLALAQAADLRLFSNRKDMKTLLEMVKNRGYSYNENAEAVK